MNRAAKAVFFLLFIYAKVVGLMPHRLNLKTKRLEYSRAGAIYLTLFNAAILILVPISWGKGLQHLVKSRQGLFGIVIWIDIALIYIIVLVTCIGRFINTQRSYKAVIGTINLVKIVYGEERPPWIQKIFFKFVLLKTLLPINQIVTISATSSHKLEPDNFWVVVGVVTIAFAHGNLCFLLNSFSLGSLIFRGVFDTIDDRLEAVFASFEESNHSSRENQAHPSNQNYLKCSEMSAKIQELMKHYSKVCYQVRLVNKILQFQLLAVGSFVFINNIFNLYEMYFVLQNLKAHWNTDKILKMCVIIWWNFVDIFILFFGTSLVNEGSVVRARRSLWKQFFVPYSNVNLDRTVSIAFYIFFILVRSNVTSD